MAQPEPASGTGHERLVIHYITLRRALGLLGFALPVVLLAGGPLLEGCLRTSISAYHYAPLRDVLTGILCAVGVFLVSYRGYDRRDSMTANIAGLAAIGVALFPTRRFIDPLPDGAAAACGGVVGESSALGTTISYVHFASAAVFFLATAYMANFLFTMSAPGRPPTPQKLKRNAVYRWCARIIVVCVAAIVALTLLPARAELALDHLSAVFWLETAAVFAFATAWTVKGETLLTDSGKVHADPEAAAAQS